MEIDIYLDVVFAINFLLDFIILLLEKKICKKRVTTNRLTLGAFTGACLMCVLTLIPNMNLLIYLITGYFLSSMIIVLITFKPDGIKETLRLTGLLYMIAILLGGFIYVIYYYSMIGVGLARLLEGTKIKGFDLQLLILFALLAFILGLIVINITTKIVSHSKNIYAVTLHFHEQVMKMNGYLDTGNNLYDPITNWPVIIGELSVFKEFLSEQDFSLIKNTIENIYDVSGFEQIKKRLQLNIRLIPYTSLGNENGMLMGVVLDLVDITDGKHRKENKNVVVALYDKKLSKDNSYNLLLHPKLI